MLIQMPPTGVVVALQALQAGLRRLPPLLLAVRDVPAQLGKLIWGLNFCVMATHAVPQRPTAVYYWQMATLPPVSFVHMPFGQLVRKENRPLAGQGPHALVAPAAQNPLCPTFHKPWHKPTGVFPPAKKNAPPVGGCHHALVVVLSVRCP